MTVKNYVLDINKTSLQHPSIVLRQDDYNIYTVNISVTENGTPVDLGSYTLNFLGITPAGAKIIDSKNFITTAGDLAVGKFSYRFPKEAAGSKGVYDVAYFRLKTSSGATSTIDLNLRVLGGIDLTADEVKDYITVDDTLRNTLVSEVFKKVDAKVDEHLATVKKGDKGDTGPAGKDGYMPVIGGRNYVLKSNVSTTSNLAFYSSVPSSYFSHKILTVSVQLDYENITSLSNQKRIGVEFVILNKDGSMRYINSWKYPTIGDSFHGRISTTFDFSNNEFKDYETNKMGGGIYIQGITAMNLSVSNPKLEIGNVATDWSPAPEDIDSEIAKAPKLNGNNMYVGDNTYMGTNTFMDGVSLNGKNVVNGLTDTDWLDIPLEEGRTGTAKYKVSFGKIFVHLDSIRGMSGTGLTNRNSYIGKIPKGSTYYIRNSAVIGSTVAIISCSPDGQIYIVDTTGAAPQTTDVLHTDFVVI